MDILETIVRHKRLEVQRLRSELDIIELRKEALGKPKPLSFKEAVSKEGINIIAEVKKASPSKGIISRNFNPLKLAKLYEVGGASAISVLTDERFFMGSDDYLRLISKNVSIPTLRKDFIIDEVQIYQARLLGASAFLLISSILSEEKLERFMELGKELKMDALVEVHCDEDLEKALRGNAEIIGVNNRNLKDFTVSTKTTIRYLPMIKESGRICISESGIKSKNDIEMLHNKGVDAFLIGETLVRSKHPDKLLRSWIE